MQKKIEWQWESLDSSTVRAKVIGGWILAHQTVEKSGKACSESMVFIADRDHEWHVIPPIVEPLVEPKKLADDFESPK